MLNAFDFEKSKKVFTYMVPVIYLNANFTTKEQNMLYFIYRTP